MENLTLSWGRWPQERALEAEQALGCLLNPWECWNAPGSSPSWDLPDKHVEHGNSHLRPRMWPGKQNVITQPPPPTPPCYQEPQSTERRAEERDRGRWEFPQCPSHAKGRPNQQQPCHGPGKLLNLARPHSLPLENGRKNGEHLSRLSGSH